MIISTYFGTAWQELPSAGFVRGEPTLCYAIPQRSDCVENVSRRLQGRHLETNRLTFARRPNSVHQHSKTSFIAGLCFLQHFLDDLFGFALCEHFKYLRGFIFRSERPARVSRLERPAPRIALDVHGFSPPLDTHPKTELQVGLYPGRSTGSASERSTKAGGSCCMPRRCTAIRSTATRSVQSPRQGRPPHAPTTRNESRRLRQHRQHRLRP